MFLYIMRHGEAESRSTSDRSRELTSQGRSQVEKVGSQFVGSVGPVSRIFCSPYVRTRQTAELMATALHFDPDHIESGEALESGSSGMTSLEWLATQLSTDALVIGHVPCVSELASLLINGHRDGAYGFQTASIIALDVEALVPGGAEMLWFRTPTDW